MGDLLFALSKFTSGLSSHSRGAFEVSATLLAARTLKPSWPSRGTRSSLAAISLSRRGVSASGERQVRSVHIGLFWPSGQTDGQRYGRTRYPRCSEDEVNRTRINFATLMSRSLSDSSEIGIKAEEQNESLYRGENAAAVVVPCAFVSGHR